MLFLSPGRPGLLGLLTLLLVALAPSATLGQGPALEPPGKFQADLSVSIDDSPDPVTAGSQVVYTVTVVNLAQINGPETPGLFGTAFDVEVTTTLDGDVSLVSTSGCTEDPSGVATCSLGDLPKGGSTQFTITADVSPTASGTLTTSVEVSHDGPDPASGNNSASAETGISQPEADLSITKTDSVDPVIAGEPLSYTVTVSNAGPQAATNVVATDTLPSGVTLVPTSGCAEDPSGAPACSLGDIPNGGSAQYTINVTVDSATSGTITNQASASSDTSDPNGGNDSTSEDTTVNQPEADLSITKTDSVDPVAAGSAFSYTVMVSNAGPQTATGVVVTDTLPAGVTFVSTTGCAEDPAGVPTCTLGDVDSGSSDSYTINVTADAQTAGTVTNMASVSSGVSDPSSANNSTTEDTEVVETDAPVVAIVNTAATSAGADGLTEDEVVVGIVNQLIVQFDEAVRDAGAADPDSVTNPANYQLVTAGSNGVVDTMGCGGAQGDDVAIVIDSVTYDDLTFEATLNLNGGIELTPDSYSFAVCGSTTIVDLAGNPLDGNGDGVGGDDFVRDFRIGLIPPIPTSSPLGLLLLVSLMAVAAVLVLRRGS